MSRSLRTALNLFEIMAVEKILYSDSEADSLIKLLCTGQAENVQIAKQLLKTSVVPLRPMLQQHAPFLLKSGYDQPRKFLGKVQNANSWTFSGLPTSTEYYKGVEYLPIVDIEIFKLRNTNENVSFHNAYHFLAFAQNLKKLGWLPQLKTVHLFQSQYEAWKGENGEPLPRLANVKHMIIADYKMYVSMMKAEPLLQAKDWQKAQVGTEPVYVFGQYSLIFYKGLWVAAKTTSKNGDFIYLKVPNGKPFLLVNPVFFESREEAYGNCLLDFIKKYPEKVITEPKPKKPSEPAQKKLNF